MNPGMADQKEADHEHNVHQLQALISMDSAAGKDLFSSSITAASPSHDSHVHSDSDGQMVLIDVILLTGSQK